VKVGIVSPYPRTDDPHGEEGLGGVASYAKSLVAPLRRRADLVVLSPHDGARSRRHDGDMMVQDVPRSGRALADALGELGASGVEAVHVQFEQHLYGGPAQNLRLARALRKLRRRAGVVTTIHQVPDLDAVDRAFLKQNGFPPLPALARAWMRVQYRALVAGSDLVIVHEERLASRLASQYGAPPARVRVVPHGVPEVADAPGADEAKARIGANGKTVLLYFGFITGYKGVDLLVGALERLPPETRQDVVVVIAGKAPERKMEKAAFRAEVESLEARIAALGPWVQRKGFLTPEEIRLYLAACDVALFPYRQVFGASGPLALALAQGRPFLLSDAFAGMGFDKRALFPRSPEGMAAKLREFLRDDRLRDALRAHAAQLREERLWPRVAAATFDCYREVGA
jgi:glycosyltransferase involved in cell wall biosynthesis